MLELTNEESFVSPSCAHRAVHLIQYIVAGVTSTPEPMLVLNKILCGLPTGEPENAALPKADELSPESRLPAAVVTPSIEGNLSQCNENAATQQTSPESGTVKKIARRHGSAMPE